MAGAAGPFLKFLSGMYPSDLQERPQQRVLSEQLKPADLTSLVIQGAIGILWPKTRETTEEDHGQDRL